GSIAQTRPPAQGAAHAAADPDSAHKTGVFGRHAWEGRALTDAAVLPCACRALVRSPSCGGCARAHDPVLGCALPRPADAILGRGGVACAPRALLGCAVNTPRRHCQVVEVETRIIRVGTPLRSYLLSRRPAPYLSLRPNSRIA